MTPERRERLEEIVEEVWDLQADARAQFLNQACADDAEMRQQIEQLLKAREELTADFLEGSAYGMLAPRLKAGQRVGRYVVEGLIGTGGMSVVYKARDPHIGRAVALKILLPSGDPEEGGGRFLSEVQALGRIEHENIVRIYDCGEWDSLPFLVMEYLEGEDLAHAIAKGRCGAMDHRLHIARQTAKALEYVHQSGIVHRDVKPANIFLQSGGRVKLMDFGIARRDGQRLTRTNQLLGTLQYMSPEQVQGHRITGLSDMYSFGIVLFELFTGSRPYSGTNAELIYKILQHPVKIDASEHAGIPSGVIEAIRMATAKDPSKRAADFTALLRSLDGEAPQTPALPRPSRRRSWLAGTIAGCAGLAVFLAPYTWRQPVPQLQPAQAEVQKDPAPAVQDPVKEAPLPSARDSVAKQPVAVPENSRDSRQKAEVKLAPKVFAPKEAAKEKTLEDVAPESPGLDRSSGPQVEPPVMPPRALPPPPATQPSATRLAETVTAKARATQQVFEVLRRFEQAYRQKDLREIVRLDEGLDASQQKRLSEAFSASREYSVRLTPSGEPEFGDFAKDSAEPGTAVVHGVRETRMIPYTGPAQADRQTVTIRLAHKDGNWRIRSVD